MKVVMAAIRSSALWTASALILILPVMKLATTLSRISRLTEIRESLAAFSLVAGMPYSLVLALGSGSH